MGAAFIAAIAIVMLPEPVVAVRTVAPAYRATAYVSAPIDEGAFAVRLTLPEEVAQVRLVGRLLGPTGELEAERVADGAPSGDYRIAFYLEAWAPGTYRFEVGAWEGETLLGEGAATLTIAVAGEREVVLDPVGCLRVSGQPLLPIGWAGPAPDDGLQRLPALGFNLWLPPEEALDTAAAEALGRVFVALPASRQSPETLANPAVLCWTLAAEEAGAYEATATADPWRPITMDAADEGSRDVAIVELPPGGAFEAAGAVLEAQAATEGMSALWLRLVPEPQDDPELLAARVRVGLALGCRGLIVAPKTGAAAEWTGLLRPILAELAGLAPFWLAPGGGFEVGCGSDGVVVCARRVGREDLVLVAGASGSDLEARLTGLPGTTLVDAEGREVAVDADGSALVAVPAYGCRLLRLRG